MIKLRFISLNDYSKSIVTSTGAKCILDLSLKPNKQWRHVNDYLYKKWNQVYNINNRLKLYYYNCNNILLPIQVNDLQISETLKDLIFSFNPNDLLPLYIIFYDIENIVHMVSNNTNTVKKSTKYNKVNDRKLYMDQISKSYQSNNTDNTAVHTNFNNNISNNDNKDNNNINNNQSCNNDIVIENKNLNLNEDSLYNVILSIDNSSNLFNDSSNISKFNVNIKISDNNTTFKCKEASENEETIIPEGSFFGVIDSADMINKDLDSITLHNTKINTNIITPNEINGNKINDDANDDKSAESNKRKQNKINSPNTLINDCNVNISNIIKSEVCDTENSNSSSNSNSKTFRIFEAIQPPSKQISIINTINTIQPIVNDQKPDNNNNNSKNNNDETPSKQKRIKFCDSKIIKSIEKKTLTTSRASKSNRIADAIIYRSKYKPHLRRITPTYMGSLGLKDKFQQFKVFL